ncbi:MULTISPECIES: site-specific integrase [Acidobacteriaceae]|uniref:tyrosine-type recombinase/integrase n=1 Tax=Acidobacteriaceae TaxID=204434 RepID=UPI00131B8B54|nr:MULTISPECIES: site-specific integrase [Acidobacteriaceae]MDW5267411.1 site-specific integrase [Edaphobacter sp.]
MFRRTRYQQGMIDRVKRKQGPDCWIFRWREMDASGKRVRRKVVLGTIEKYPTESSALKAAESLRVTVNEEQPRFPQQPISVAALITHFKHHELGPMQEDDEGRAYSTRVVYKDVLRLYVEPKWGDAGLREVRAVAVEKWLRTLPLAKGTKAKVRNIMSVLFNHAIRHEFLPQGANPITMVRQSAKRVSVPDILDVAEIVALFEELSHRERVMVLLDALTGLRRGELMALKWQDVNFKELELSVTRSIYRKVVGPCKTEASQKPVPLDPWIAEELLTWRRATPYNQSEDWIFASTRMKGKQPYSPDTILMRCIRPAATRAKITKRIGWHTFRRTLSTLLKANGEDVKVVQELLRHASAKITLDVYAQAVTPDKRRAQSKVAEMLRAGSGTKEKSLLDPSGPSAISEEAVSD